MGIGIVRAVYKQTITHKGVCEYMSTLAGTATGFNQVIMMACCEWREVPGNLPIVDSIE